MVGTWAGDKAARPGVPATADSEVFHCTGIVALAVDDVLGRTGINDAGIGDVDADSLFRTVVVGSPVI